MTDELYEIKDVEIFATGEHNGDKYDAADLDDIVTAFGKQGFAPAVKLGHSDDVGGPAYGWVENLRRQGTKLIGDLTHLSKEVYELIRRRAYDRVSAEIYWNLKTGGKTFRRALRALALLGAEVPAVTSLAPLHTRFTKHEGIIRTYCVQLNGVKQMTEIRTFAEAIGAREISAGTEIDRRARQYMTTHGEQNYAVAMRAVLAADIALAERYASGE